MSTTTAMYQMILELLECFEPTSPTTFIGRDGTVVYVPDEVEDIIARAEDLLDEDESSIDEIEEDDLPWN